MRVSGVLLVLLLAVHVLDRHVVHDSATIDADFVADRWRNPFWRMWDAALLALALLHGGHGVRTVVADLVADPGRRLVAVWAVGVVTALALLLAAITVLGA